MRFLQIILLMIVTVQSHAKKVDITLVQANNVHELASVNRGSNGGLARVETVVQKLKNKNKHTYTILSGGLFSPSAIGSAVVGGERVTGKQMVDVLNTMKWDYVTLGEHAFENDRETMLKRFSEARFKIVSSNVLDSKTGKPFLNTVSKEVFFVKGVKVGIASIILPSRSSVYAATESPFSAAKTMVKELKEQQGVDVLILVTNQTAKDDMKFVNKLSGVDLIIGGGDSNVFVRQGTSFSSVAKVDTNARSVYIHQLTYDTANKSLQVESRLKEISGSIKEDAKVKRVVDHWVGKAFDSFRDDGFDPEQIVTITTDRLDGAKSRIRSGSTQLTRLVSSSALNSMVGADISLINAGAIRIDDVIPAGPVSQYDVIRILPFGGTYELVSVPGDLLEKALNVGLENRGTGSFLHHTNVEFLNNHWMIKGERLEHQKLYKVATTNFVIYRGVAGLEFLTSNPRVRVLRGEAADVRISLMTKLKRDYPSISILRQEEHDYLAQY